MVMVDIRVVLKSIKSTRRGKKTNEDFICGPKVVFIITEVFFLCTSLLSAFLLLKNPGHSKGREGTVFWALSLYQLISFNGGLRGMSLSYYF